MKKEIKLYLSFWYIFLIGIYYKKEILQVMMILQLLNMLDQQHNLFIQYTRKIRNMQHFQKILDKVEHILDFKPFKIQNLTSQKALKTYKNLHYRYKIIKQLQVLPDGWYQCEKGLFVWFMLLYTYYRSKEGMAIGSIAEARVAVNYEQISQVFFEKSTIFLEFQFLNLIKTTDKLIWTEADDNLLITAVKKFTYEKWTQISMQIFTNSNRQKFINSKHCRQRWHNHLDETKVKGNWQTKQDIIILQFVLERQGKKWSKMKNALGGRRTEHMIKNRYHSLITKNRIHKNTKEAEIAKMLLRKLRQQSGVEIQIPQIDNNQGQFAKEIEIVQHQQQNGLNVLKQENMSPQSVKNGMSENVFICQRIVEREIDKNEIKQQLLEKNREKKLNMLSNEQQNINQLYNQQKQELNVYPFQNYNYQLEINNYNSQIYQYHQNQMNQNHIIFYHQYMTYNHVIPTSQSYVNTFQYQIPQSMQKGLQDQQDKKIDNL